MTPELAAIIGTIFGGAGLKLVEGWFAKQHDDRQTDSERIDKLYTRVDKLERRDVIKSRIILAQQFELQRLVPNYQPGPELTADLKRLEEMEAEDRK